MSFQVQRFVSNATIANLHSWPMRIVASSSDGADIPAEIFVYQVGQTSTEAAYAGDRFVCVASVHQLQELGTKSAQLSLTVNVPYYRSAELELVFRSLSEREEVWQNILDDIHDLVNNSQLLQDLQPETPLVLLS